MNEESQSDRKWRSIEKEKQEQVNEKMTVVYFSSKSQKIYAKIGSTNRSQNVNTESLLLSKKKMKTQRKNKSLLYSTIRARVLLKTQKNWIICKT